MVDSLAPSTAGRLVVPAIARSMSPASMAPNQVAYAALTAALSLAVT